MNDLLNDPAPAPDATPDVAPPADATPAPAADPNAALTADTSKSWLDDLPDDLKTAPSLARYSSKEALARGYLNAEKMIGSEKVPIPKDPNDTEAWDRY